LNSDFVAAGLLSLGLLVAGCDNAPPGTHPQSPKTETPAKQVADLIRSAEGRDGQGPSAEQAQFELGERYYRGEGVPRDMAKAAEWWQEAAEQGHASAQYSLGFMYYRGEGVPEDNVLAHAWFNLSARSGVRLAIEHRGTVEHRMSAAEIAEAQRLSSTWTLGQNLVR
jgi:TPR repeat protein